MIPPHWNAQRHYGRCLRPSRIAVRSRPGALNWHNALSPLLTVHAEFEAFAPCQQHIGFVQLFNALNGRNVIFWELPLPAVCLETLAQELAVPVAIKRRARVGKARRGDATVRSGIHLAQLAR